MADATFAIKIASVFTRATNSKLRYRQIICANRAMFDFGGQLNLHHIPHSTGHKNPHCNYLIQATLHLGPALPASGKVVYFLVLFGEDPNGATPGLPLRNLPHESRPT